MTNDLIHEVEEAIKQERTEKFLKEYGPYLIAAAVIAVLLTAAISGWRSYELKVNQSQTAILLQALDTTDPVPALQKAEGDLRANHKALAGLTAAGLLINDGKEDEALAQYNMLAQDSGLDPVFRDLASLMAVRLEWAMQKPDVNPQALLGSLGKIWGNDKSPWRWHAREQAALILAHGLNDYAAAREQLAVIIKADKNVINSLRERAGALDHVYAMKMSEAAPQEKPASPDKKDQEG